MKRLPVMALALLAAATVSSADDSEKQHEYSISAGADAAFGLTGILVGGQARFIWKPNFFGLSAGVRAETDVNALDVYLIPNAGVRLGWFVLEGGASIKAVDAPAPQGQMEASLEPVSPFIRAGLSIPIGPLSIDIGARAMMTDTYIAMEVDDIGDAIAAPIVVAIIAVLGIVKLDLGLNYAYSF